MAHLPPGLGVPDGPLSFDHLLSIFIVIEVGAIVVLALLIWWTAYRHARLAGAALARVRARRRLPRTSRPAARRIHLVTRGGSA